ncbi:hypothetical protein, partial [Thermomonospora catenispora]|uniref:hypothetical protein n=1 Tax=Thermomonospora catenispora TaxID=2493090 RepID=UPI001375B602
ITDKILYWLASLIDDSPEPPAEGSLPGWVDSASGYAGHVFGIASGVGAWVDFGLLAVVVSAVLLSLVTGFGIKVARLGVGFTTGRNL